MERARTRSSQDLELTVPPALSVATVMEESHSEERDSERILRVRDRQAQANTNKTLRI